MEIDFFEDQVDENVLDKMIGRIFFIFNKNFSKKIQPNQRGKKLEIRMSLLRKQ